MPLPIILGIHASYKKKTATWQLNGRLTEGGLAVPTDALVVLYKGSSANVLAKIRTTKVNAAGNWTVSGKLKPKKTTFFQLNAIVPERDYTAQGCANPLTPFAPAGWDGSLCAGCRWERFCRVLGPRPPHAIGGPCPAWPAASEGASDA